MSWVFAPAASATGVREELLLIGNPWNSPAARLAAPRPIISWFGSTWERVLAAYVRDRTLVSANATMATAQPPITTWPRSARSIHGSANDGRPCGSGPSTFTPALSSRPSTPTATVAPTTAIRRPGIRFQGLSSRIAASVPAPTANAVQLAWPPRIDWAICTRSRSGPTLSIEKPNSLGSWLISTVSAMPFM